MKIFSTKLELFDSCSKIVLISIDGLGIRLSATNEREISIHYIKKMDLRIGSYKLPFSKMR